MLTDLYKKKDYTMAGFDERSKVEFAAVVGDQCITRKSPDRETQVTATEDGVFLECEGYVMQHPADAARLMRELRLSFAEHMWMKMNPGEDPRVYSQPFDIDLILEVAELQQKNEELESMLAEILDDDDED